MNRTMLGRALKMAFWVTYDHLGKLVLANLICVAAIGLPILGTSLLLSVCFGDAEQATPPILALVVALGTLILLLGVVLPSLTAGLAHMVKVLIERKDGSLGDFFAGIRLHWLRATGIGFTFLLAAACFATSSWFYAGWLKDSVPWLGYALSAAALWCLAMLAVMSILVGPTLVQKKGGVWATMKLTALLILANPLLSLGITLQVIAITAVSLIIPPLALLLYGSVVVVLASSAYELLSRKYLAMDQSAEGEEASPSGRRAPVIDDDEDDDYLNRGFRDFLFPWKG
jgi:uncharacterized membrane protein YesL